MTVRPLDVTITTKDTTLLAEKRYDVECASGKYYPYQVGSNLHLLQLQYQLPVLEGNKSEKTNVLYYRGIPTHSHNLLVEEFQADSKGPNHGEQSSKLIGLLYSSI